MTNKYHFKGHCTKCNEELETSYQGHFVRCECGKSFFDAGDGFHCRMGGNFKMTQAPNGDLWNPMEEGNE